MYAINRSPIPWKKLLPYFYLVFIFASIFVYIDENMHKQLHFSLGAYTIDGFLIVKVLFVFYLAIFLNKVTRVLFWDLLVHRIIEGPPPTLLVQLSTGIIYLIAILSILSFLLGKSIAGFLTASGVVGVIIGFGIQRLVLDTFSGISLNLDRPFHVGDWVMIYQGNNNTLIGQIKGISWRTACLLTPEDNYVTVPNSVLGQSVIINYSHPTSISAFELDYAIKPIFAESYVLKIFTNGLASLKHKDQVLSMPKPTAYITKVDTLGIHYRIKYYINCSHTSPAKARHFVHFTLLKHLRTAGIDLANSCKQEITLLKEQNSLGFEVSGPQHILRSIDLFSLFSPQEIGQLAEKLTEKRHSMAEIIVKQGDAGDSLFIVKEGCLTVYIHEEESEDPLKVGTLQPEDIFGEMSLLTGAPRSATIIAQTDVILYEITKEDISDILKDHPNFPIQLAKIIYERELKNKSEQEKSVNANKIEEPSKSYIQDLATRISRYFLNLL